MSQLKKQTIVSRKGARTPQTRKTAKGTSFQSGVLRLCRSAGKALFSLLYRPFKNARFRWPIAALAVSAALTSGGLIAYSASKLLTGVVEHLPDRLEVRCLRIDLREKIAEIASDTLRQAQKSKSTRTALMDKLMSRISKLDGVDEVRIRAGLDGKVLVDVSAQTPFLVLQGKGSERVLVGNQFKIIARSLPSNSYGHLPHIVTPELSLNLSYSSAKSETYTGYFVRPSINAGVNVRWLSQQTIDIYSLFESMRLPLKVEKVVWKEVSGFNVAVAEKVPTPTQIPGVGMSDLASTQEDTPATPTSPHRYNVVLGENDFREKFSRLKQVIDDLQLKKTVVDQIDLGYSDKAIIKVNEQLSELKRGGL